MNCCIKFQRNYFEDNSMQQPLNAVHIKKKYSVWKLFITPHSNLFNYGGGIIIIITVVEVDLEFL